MLAGGAGWKTGALHRRIARSAFRDKIHVTGYAARDAARALYRAAEVFVYPSLFEGFGLPGAGGDGVRHSGRRVHRRCAPGGRRRRGALRAAPRPRGYSPSRSSARSTTSALRARCAAAGPERAAAFSWEAAAEKTAAAVAEVVEGAGAQRESRATPRIGFDARKLTHFGIGSYIRNLLEAIGRSPASEAYRFRVYVPSRDREAAPALPDALRDRRRRIRPATRWRS